MRHRLFLCFYPLCAIIGAVIRMRSVKAPVSLESVVSKSRFIVYLTRVRDAAQAGALLAEARRLHPDATHHCFAYVLSPDAGTYRAADDGEPGGTAGTPMLEAIRKGGYTDVAAVVVRYYGGVKLGAGGLARAYGGAVRAALAKAETVNPIVYETYAARNRAPFIGAVEHELRSLAKVVGCVYGDPAEIRCRVRAKDASSVVERLARMTSSSVDWTLIDTSIEYE